MLAWSKNITSFHELDQLFTTEHKHADVRLSFFHTSLQLMYRFDVSVNDLPEPALDWAAFAAGISALNDRTPMVWNPISQKMAKWVDMYALTRCYGRKVPETCCDIQ